MILRALAVIVGLILFCFPGYLLLRIVSGLSLLVALLVLYGGLFIGVAIQLKPPRDLAGFSVFMAGLISAVVLGVIGFFGPFGYAWLTNTKVGNLTPIFGVFAFVLGAILAAGAGLIAYGITGELE